MSKAGSKETRSAGEKRKGKGNLKKTTPEMVDRIPDNFDSLTGQSAKNTDRGESFSNNNTAVVNDKENPLFGDTEDDFLNLKRLRLTQNFTDEISVKKVITIIPARKPNRHEYIRVRSGEEWRLQTCVLTLKNDPEAYLVDPGMWSALSLEIVPTMLFTSINREGVLFVWPAKLPREDGRRDNWGRSAFKAATMAESKWVRIASNMNLGAYEVYEAQGDLPDPEWPELSFAEIIRIAFKENFIKDPEHPVIRRLRGLA